jgi:hypothetical protein
VSIVNATMELTHRNFRAADLRSWTGGFGSVSRPAALAAIGQERLLA